MPDVRFSKSRPYRERYPEVPFGFVLVTGCQNPVNPPGFDQYKRKKLRRMRSRATLAEIEARIGVYDRFFRGFGYACPLPGHLKRTVNSGFPRYNIMVDAHFMAEMCAGILVAAADFQRFDGGLTLDVSEGGETCEGMGGRTMTTRAGEIVLRDEKEIVCVLCQGADEKTRVTERTQDVLFYAYAVPGIDAQHLETGLALAGEAVSRFGGGACREVRIF